MQRNTKAAVIRVKNMDEFDRVLTLLTPDRGLVQAYAKGVRKMKGSAAAATELLSYSNFTLFFRQEKVFVDKAEPEKIFFGIRQRIEELSLASYFCQLLTELVSDTGQSDGPLRLLLNCLHFLDTQQISRALLKPLFELRLLAMSGYMPDLISCSFCGEEPDAGSVLFSPSEGFICCEECLPARGGFLKLSPAVFAAMRHIIYSDFSRLFSFRLSEEALPELSHICEQYLLAQVERVLPALKFYQAIC